MHWTFIWDIIENQNRSLNSRLELDPYPTENRIRYASGPVYFQTIRYIDTGKKFDTSEYING